MNFIKNIYRKIKNLNLKIKIISIILILLLVGLIGFKINSNKTSLQYETAQVEKGTLIVSLAESGQVSVSNKVSVVTQASGIVNDVYVKPGDTVNAGDRIAEVVLDTAGQQRQAQAYASLLSAQNSVNSANAQLYSLQNALFVANQKFINDKGITDPSDQQKQDPIYIEENANWLAAEATYKNQSQVIAQAQASLSNANLSYQLTSGIIIAPTSGVVGDLLITKGIQIGSNNTTAGSSSNTSNQQIASIKTGQSTVVSINIAEVDIPQIKVGQRATVTFDALTDKSFTGKIVGVDTTGSVSSGVTTYPAIVELDQTSESILPNMSATVNIISKIEDNVLLIPAAAVQTTGEVSTVRVLKNGKIAIVKVEIGDSSNGQTVIKSGLSEGELIVTNEISSGASSTSTASPFSGNIRFGSFGGASRTATGGR